MASRPALLSWNRRCSSPSLVAHLQHGQERLLGNLDVPDLLHPLFPFFLLFEQLPLARDVAAVAFRRDVLAHGLDGFSRHHATADGRLDDDLEHLPRESILSSSEPAHGRVGRHGPGGR